MNTQRPLPPFGIIEGALRLTTETLAREIAAPTDTPPGWNDFEWDVARAVCAMQGIGALLASRCRWAGPPTWTAFLHDQQRQGLAHFEVAGQVLRRLDTSLRDAGIPCVALKGSALRALEIHAPGLRPMGDIDVLVEPGHIAACAAALANIGYEPGYTTRRHDVFLPTHREPAHAFAEHVRNPLRIELHPRVAECLPVTEIDITPCLWPTHPKPGINRYASRAALMRHLLLHTAGNMRAHAMRFIQLYDIAELARRFDAEDWRELLGAPPQTDAWWMYPPLALAARYLPGRIAAETLDPFHEACPRWLRKKADAYRLYDVSWSNLRIDALPGGEWSRSPFELLRYAKRRTLPNRAALDDLGSLLRVQPEYTRVRWYDASHAERIVRWIFLRPPRVQTLTSIRAAMEHAL